MTRLWGHFTDATGTEHRRRKLVVVGSIQNLRSSQHVYLHVTRGPAKTQANCSAKKNPGEEIQGLGTSPGRREGGRSEDLGGRTLTGSG